MHLSRGIVLEELPQPGSQYFVLRVLIPVAESFRFMDEIRNRDCGESFPQLVFYGWEVNADDPFRMPVTAEELEEFGDAEFAPNSAQKLVKDVRERKGLELGIKLKIKDTSLSKK